MDLEDYHKILDKGTVAVIIYGMYMCHLPLHGVEDLDEEGGDAGEERQVDFLLRLEDRDELDEPLSQPLHAVHPEPVE